MPDVLSEWQEAEQVEALHLFSRLRATGYEGDFPAAVLQALRVVVAQSERQQAALAGKQRVSPCPRCRSARICFCPEDYP